MTNGSMQFFYQNFVIQLFSHNKFDSMHYIVKKMTHVIIQVRRNSNWIILPGAWNLQFSTKTWNRFLLKRYFFSIEKCEQFENLRFQVFLRIKRQFSYFGGLQILCIPYWETLLGLECLKVISSSKVKAFHYKQIHTKSKIKRLKGTKLKKMMNLEIETHWVAIL